MRISLLIVFLLAFVILFSFCSFDGYYFYDDTTYARYAFQLAHGKLNLNEETFSHRLGIILPTAGAYLLFGVNDFTTLWWPFVCTLATLWIVYRLLQSKDAVVALWAVALTGLDFYTLFFSNKLYPDVGLTLMALLAAVALYRRDYSWRQPVVFVLANFWGFLCKETVVYLLPFYLLVWLYDLRQQQYGQFWCRALGLGIPVLLLYFGFYYVWTGNALYRFQIIQDGHYVASYNYFHQPAAALIPRLTYEPILMLIHSGMIICMIPAGAVLFRKHFWQWKRWSGPLFWSRIAFTGLTMFWFFTTSFRYYNPNALFPRMILFLIPFFAIASAYELRTLTTRKTFILAAFFVIVSVVAGQTIGVKLAVQYALLAAGYATIGAGFAFRRDTVFTQSRFYIPLMISILLIHPVYSMCKPTESGYRAEKYLIRNYLRYPAQQTLVFVDDKLLHGYDFYYQFRPPVTIRFLPFEELPLYRGHGSSSHQLYVLINPYSVAYFREIGVDIPEYIQNPPASWELITETERIKLYEVTPHGIRNE